MQSYQPQTLLSGRFLLKEQLSRDAVAGQQVWAVTDTQTGKGLIARIHANGHIDWFNDNRPDTAEVKPAAAPSPSPGDQAASSSSLPPVAAATPPEPEADRRRKGGGIWFFLLLLAVAGIFGYYNQSLVKDQISAIKSHFPGGVDSLATDPTGDPVRPPTGAENNLFGHNSSLPVWEPEATETVSPPAAADNTDGPAEALRMQFRMISAADPYAEISTPDFDKAAALLRQLRQAGRHPILCDSIYTIATDRADQFYLGFRNNRPEAREKAVAWYKISAAAKESGHSKKRLSELQPPRQTRKESTPVTDYFPKDPELNLN
ncbi:hypothetical protein GCM10023091_25390 [Ravibacter arvi]|uniref:Uncharacterized protein n=1 Tax=Ravibacter arvi TaxID=2051041 RepID=A0ABP8LZ71_9BACT